MNEFDPRANEAGSRLTPMLCDRTQAVLGIKISVKSR